LQQAQQKRQQAVLSLAEKKNRDWLSALERGDNARAKSLNVEIDAMLKSVQLGYDPRQYWTQQRLNQIATAIWKERKAGVEDSPRQQELLQKLRALLPATKRGEQEILNDGRAAVYNPDLQKAYSELNSEIIAGREDSTNANELRARIQKLRVVVPSNSSYEERRLQSSYHTLALKLAQQYARKLDYGASEEEAKPILERARRNFEHATSSKDSFYRSNFESLLAQGWAQVASDATYKIAKEIAAGRENSSVVQKATESLERAQSHGARASYDTSYAIKNAWKGRAHETAYRLLQARQKGDEKTALALEKRLQMEVEKAGETPLDSYLEWEKSRLKKGEPMITAADYRLRWGDPLISVRAPANCRKVVAILPSGELLPLAYDADKSAWEARFDVPMYATEGEYKVVIILVGADGARQTLAMFFNVDTTAPTGKGDVRFQNDVFDLRLTSDENTDRVAAFLPWNERVELRRDESGAFGAKVSVPVAWQKRAATVRFVVTDKAHNRTELEVDWSSDK
jgi:hypothetical protein